MNDLDIKVRTIFETLEENQAKKNKLQESLKHLSVERDSLETMARKMQESMYKGKKLDDIETDFCFFHFGLDMQNKVAEVRTFLNEMKKYGGQLLLINQEGYNWTSTQIVDGHLNSGRREREIELVRLSSMAYKIKQPGRNVVATASEKQRYVHNSGWSDYARDISLNTFLFEYSKRVESPMSAAAIKLAEEVAKHFPKVVPKPTGLRVDIYSPLIEQLKIGGSNQYDSEPHLSLVVGNEAVKYYLSQQKLVVKKIEENVANIPQI